MDFQFTHTNTCNISRKPRVWDIRDWNYIFQSEANLSLALQFRLERKSSDALSTIGLVAFLLSRNFINGPCHCKSHRKWNSLSSSFVVSERINLTPLWLAYANARWKRSYKRNMYQYTLQQSICRAHSSDLGINLASLLENQSFIYLSFDSISLSKSCKFV